MEKSKKTELLYKDIVLSQSKNKVFLIKSNFIDKILEKFTKTMNFTKKRVVTFYFY